MHYYAAAGTYTIKIKADCYKCTFSVYPQNVHDVNGNWDALGNITDGSKMFYGCSNAVLTLQNLPQGLVNGTYMFRGCENAQLSITKLPAGLVTCASMFHTCRKAVIDLDTLVANAPAEGWTELTDISYMFHAASPTNSPGTVTGSRSAFLAKLPNVTNTTSAFYGTNTI